MPAKVNLAEAFASFDETWSPRVAAELDGFEVKLVKLAGELVWHHHDDADELFLVVLRPAAPAVSRPGRGGAGGG